MSKDPKIPRVRDIIETLSKWLELHIDNPEQVQWVAQQMRELTAKGGLLWREPRIRQSPPQSNPITPQIEVRILGLAKNRHDWTEAEIAAEVGVNQGRVSEVLTKHRSKSHDPDDPSLLPRPPDNDDKLRNHKTSGSGGDT